MTVVLSAYRSGALNAVPAFGRVVVVVLIWPS